MIYLAQTDTTAGFLSQDLVALNNLKGRAKNQPCIIAVASFAALKNFARVPAKYRALVRRARKTTFIYSNLKSVRVVKDHPHALFLARLGWAYSTSANAHGKDFDEDFARANADEIVDEKLFAGRPSRIFRLSRTAIKKVR